MSQKSLRLGTIIKIIINNPGITYTSLYQKVIKKLGNVSNRTVAKDIKILKEEFGLLPKVERLRSGYILDGCVTLSIENVGIVIDALNSFGIDLADSKSSAVVRELSNQLSELPMPISAKASMRLLRHRNIARTRLEEESLENSILNAIKNRTAVCIKYSSPRVNDPMNIVVFPLFKIFYDRCWYYIVRENDKRNYFPLRQDRILSSSNETKIKALTGVDYSDCCEEARYLISTGWGMTFPYNIELLKHARKLPKAIVRFDSSVARYILETANRHPHAHIQQLKDGTGDVLFSINLSDYWEFQNWVRSFGSCAWFLAPKDIVEQEKRQLRLALERYK